MIVNKEHLAIASSPIPYILAIIGYAQMIYKQYLRRNDRKVYSSRYFPNNMRAFVIPFNYIFTFYKKFYSPSSQCLFLLLIRQSKTVKISVENVINTHAIKYHMIWNGTFPFDLYVIFLCKEKLNFPNPPNLTLIK